MCGLREQMVSRAVQCSATSDISLLSLIIEQNKPQNHCTIKYIELVRQGCNGKMEFSCIVYRVYITPWSGFWYRQEEKMLSNP